MAPAPVKQISHVVIVVIIDTYTTYVPYSGNQYFVIFSSACTVSCVLISHVVSSRPGQSIDCCCVLHTVYVMLLLGYWRCLRACHKDEV